MAYLPWRDIELPEIDLVSLAFGKSTRQDDTATQDLTELGLTEYRQILLIRGPTMRPSSTLMLRTKPITSTNPKRGLLLNVWHMCYATNLASGGMHYIKM